MHKLVYLLWQIDLNSFYICIAAINYSRNQLHLFKTCTKPQLTYRQPYQRNQKPAALPLFIEKLSTLIHFFSFYLSHSFK